MFLNLTLCCILYFNADLENIPRSSALEEISDEEAIQIVVPHALPPAAFSLRDYVEQSETLTKLVQLGEAICSLQCAIEQFLTSSLKCSNR